MAGKCNVVISDEHTMLRNVRSEDYLDVSVCRKCSVVQRSQQAGALLAMLLYICNITNISLH